MCFKNGLYQISDRLFTAFALALIASVLALSGTLNRLDDLTFDLGRYLSFKPAPSDVVIVAIDEASLQQVGRWPWPRSVHASLVNTLSAEKPAAIGLDIIFSEPDLQQPAADVALQKAITNAGNVVLPVLLEMPFAGAPIKQSLPLPLFAVHAAALGRVHVPLDADGLARSIYLQEGLNGFSQTHFSEAILRVAKQLPPALQAVQTNVALNKKQSTQPTIYPKQLFRDQLRKLNFTGPPGHFQRISYADVLFGKTPANYFKNKIVLVGATAVGLGDVLPTAVSAKSAPMPGVEFHANALESMRNNALITPVSLWKTVLLSALFAVLPLLWMHRLSPFKSLMSLSLYFLAVLLIAILAAHYVQYWVAPASALVAILFAYPIWSWRKLESAQRFLDEELHNLQEDLANIGVDSDEDARANKQLNKQKDPLQLRIDNIQLTAKKLRSLQRDRSDTLAFISHDIRAPLGSAMMLMHELEESKYATRVSAMLTRAHAMAENFLQASRAEMANQKNFQPIDLVSLTQQVLDDAYSVAASKQVKLVFNIEGDSADAITEAGVWVMGDFGLLQRALANVVINAVKYSPTGNIVNVALALNNAQIETAQVTLKVTDYGPGIAADKIPKLFKRYSRAEGEHQAADGTGLGLYFVYVTLQKHHGNVSVESQLGIETTFLLSLPTTPISQA